MIDETTEAVRILEPGAGVVHAGRVVRAGERLEMPRSEAHRYVQEGWAEPTIRVRVLQDHVIINRVIHAAGDLARTTGLHAEFLESSGQAERVEADDRG